MKSEQIGEIAKALASVQVSLTPAHKNKKNPFFKSDYADLVAIWESCRGPLAANGLSITQTTDTAEDGSTELVTTLLHASGQWIEGRYPIKAIKQDPQGIGSAITYARRYALMAIVGIVTDDDDDGEHAMGRAKHAAPAKAANDWIPDEPPHRNLPSGFVPPEVTPAMKARFEKVESEQIKAQAQAIIPEPLGFEEPPAEAIYVNGNTLVFFGKNKGKSFSEIGRDGLEKSIWGAKKGLSEGSDWVDKVGVSNVETFIKQAEAYLASGKHGY